MPSGRETRRIAHSSGATAEVYRHGAHVTSWVPAGGREALFLSRASKFGEGAAIRGGIPVIFPQFADRGPLPKHGFARTRAWGWVEQDDPTRAELELRDDAETRALWPHSFRAHLGVTISASTLAVELRIENVGSESLEFTAALHTYLRVGDVRKIHIVGLQGVSYRDKVTGETRVQSDLQLAISGEVDRVYHNVQAPLEVHDPVAGRSIRVSSAGFEDVVVWNPWSEKARALPDLADDEYLHMVCVEAAQVEDPVNLVPGEHWLGRQQLEVADL